MRRNLGWALVVVLFMGALLAPAAGAKARYPRLAQGFGTGGYLALPGQLPGPTGETTGLESLAAAPGGAVYASESAQVAGSCRNGCLYRVFLARVNSDGSIATTFGGSGLVEIGDTAEEVSPVVSDPEGRALVVTTQGSKVTVHRYLPDGSADAGFGGAGATSLDCGCAASFRQLRVAVDGQGRVVVSISVEGNLTTARSSTLARLLPSGAIDGRFGSGGVLQLGPQPATLGIAFGSGNAIYLWGAACCEQTASYLHRVSAKGLIDSQFDARADKTLANVASRRAIDSGNALVVRPHGLLDYYAGPGLLRLRSDGNAEVKFGQSGVRALPEEVVAATLVGHGRTLGLGAMSGGEMSLLRLQADGRPDRSFGSEGEKLIEGVLREEGVSLARLKGRRAQVLDLGATFCRYGGCLPHPSLIRYRIGPKS
jgi:uncharacterized delta-60 repeat protein